MNYNPAPWSRRSMKEWQTDMAKWEIMKRFGPLQGLWWRFMPGVEIEVPWPTGVITVGHNHPKWDWSLGATLQEGFSADPNDHFRPELEQLVGKQGWDWDWRIGRVAAEANIRDTLVIKFRRAKAHQASFFKLKFG